MLNEISSNPSFGIIKTFMGRDALRLAICALDLGSDDAALLPAYLCVEVLKPFAARCKVELYDVGPDATVDPDEIEAQLARHHPRVVLFINYFGFLQPHRARIRALCEQHGVLLIEDCAHSLLTQGSGETGDWAVYSFRKILPVLDGGGLRANRAAERLQPHFRSGLWVSVLVTLKWLKSVLHLEHQALTRGGLSGSMPVQISPEAFGRNSPKLLPMSAISRRRLARLDVHEIVTKRRSDYQFWLDWSASTPGIAPLADRLPEGVCPQGFPAFVKDRERWKSRLEREGILVRTHWRLPECVGPRFANSRRLASGTLTLPIYHEFTEEQRRRVSGMPT